jgi:hypothetical protein
MESYTIKFDNGSSSFEITAPNQEWVDNRFADLKELLTSPATRAASSPKSTGTVKQSTATTPRGRKKSTTKAVELNPVLGESFNEELIGKINSFIKERSKAFEKGTTKQAAILAAFLKDSLGIELVSPTDLEFIYRKMGWDTINHAAQLSNSRTRDKFFMQNQGKLELTHNGLKFGRDTSKDSDTSEDAA